jgi:hypothetical protein
MAYHELPLSPNLPSDDRDFIRDQVEPYLRDAHAMLRLPVPTVPGLEAGCNFSVAQVLLSVVSGVSVTLYDPTALEADGVSGPRFKELLKKHYPWGEERHLPGAQLDGDAAEQLWRLLRNPLAHTLGVIGPQRNLRFNPAGLTIEVEKGSIPEEAIEHDEQAATRPSNADDWKTKPTLRKEADHLKLWLRSFYWGVRKTILNVAAARVRGGVSTLPQITATQWRTT